MFSEFWDSCIGGNVLGGCYLQGTTTFTIPWSPSVTCQMTQHPYTCICAVVVLLHSFQIINPFYQFLSFFFPILYSQLVLFVQVCNLLCVTGLQSCLFMLILIDFLVKFVLGLLIIMRLLLVSVPFHHMGLGGRGVHADRDF